MTWRKYPSTFGWGGGGGGVIRVFILWSRPGFKRYEAYTKLQLSTENLGNMPISLSVHLQYSL